MKTRHATPLITRHGFTLVEVLVACSILTLILLLVGSLTGQARTLWMKTEARVSAFQGAERAFGNLVKLVGQATLNTYWTYDNPNAPKRYVRQSELHFLLKDAATLLAPDDDADDAADAPVFLDRALFFQAPTGETRLAALDGVEGLLASCGFYIAYGSDKEWLPAHVPPQNARNRYRLYQWMDEAETLSVYTRPGNAWVELSPGSSTPLVDNIVAFIVRVRDAGATGLDAYTYDSRVVPPGAAAQPMMANQLPPMLEIAMVAMDEPSAARLGPDLFSTIQACRENLFTDPPSGHFEADLKTLEERLTQHAVTHRTFRSVISLPEAKWSAL